jgi:hypothetical protein
LNVCDSSGDSSGDSCGDSSGSLMALCVQAQGIGWQSIVIGT